MVGEVDVVGVASDPEPVGRPEEGPHAGTARVAAGVPRVWEAVLGIERSDAHPAHGARPGGITGERVVQVALVAAHVDSRPGRGHLGQAVAAGVVHPRRKLPGAGGAALPPLHGVAQDAGVRSAEPRAGVRDHEVRAVRREADVADVGIEAGRARGREGVRLPRRHRGRGGREVDQGDLGAIEAVDLRERPGCDQLGAVGADVEVGDAQLAGALVGEVERHVRVDGTRRGIDHGEPAPRDAVHGRDRAADVEPVPTDVGVLDPAPHQRGLEAGHDRAVGEAELDEPLLGLSVHRVERAAGEDRRPVGPGRERADLAVRDRWGEGRVDQARGRVEREDVGSLEDVPAGLHHAGELPPDDDGVADLRDRVHDAVEHGRCSLSRNLRHDARLGRVQSSRRRGADEQHPRGDREQSAVHPRSPESSVQHSLIRAYLWFVPCASERPACGGPRSTRRRMPRTGDVERNGFPPIGTGAAPTA